MPNRLGVPFTRRAFLHRGALALASAAGACAAVRGLLGREEQAEDPSLRIGLLADVHYGDKPASGNRACRESIPKAREAVKRFAERKVEIALELGDFVDEAGTAEGELAHLKAIEAELAAFPGERHHVLGNHCVWTLTKEEFLGAVGAKEGHYSFDRGGFHLVVLDACYRSDGVPCGRRNNEWTDAEVPPAEREWLAEDLARTDKRAIVFIHHRLDVDTPYAIRRAARTGSWKPIAMDLSCSMGIMSRRTGRWERGCEGRSGSEGSCRRPSRDATASRAGRSLSESTKPTKFSEILKGCRPDTGSNKGHLGFSFFLCLEGDAT